MDLPRGVVCYKSSLVATGKSVDFLTTFVNHGTGQSSENLRDVPEFAEDLALTHIRTSAVQKSPTWGLNIPHVSAVNRSPTLEGKGLQKPSSAERVTLSHLPVAAHPILTGRQAHADRGSPTV